MHLILLNYLFRYTIAALLWALKFSTSANFDYSEPKKITETENF